MKKLYNKRKDQGRAKEEQERGDGQASVLKGMDKKGLKAWLLSMTSWTAGTKASIK